MDSDPAALLLRERQTNASLREEVARLHRSLGAAELDEEARTNTVRPDGGADFVPGAMRSIREDAPLYSYGRVLYYLCRAHILDPLTANCTVAHEEACDCESRAVTLDDGSGS